MTYREAIDEQKRLIKFRERHYYYGAKTDNDEGNAEAEIIESQAENFPPDIDMNTIRCYPL